MTRPALQRQTNKQGLTELLDMLALDKHRFFVETIKHEG